MRTYHMADILPLLGLPYPPQGGSSYYIPCPCCDSGRHKHLNISLTKDVFRCPRCGFSGGLFDLYAHYTGVKREDVLGELVRRLGGEDAGYASGIQSGSRSVPCSPCPSQPTEVTDNPPTDVDTRNATYRALLDMLSLASDHAENLLARGLSHEAIAANGYRTTPVAGAKAMARKLMADGHYLAGVPGFYRDAADQAWTFTHCQRGMLIPVRDCQGRIQGLQIRRDNAERRKFRWVSSAELPEGCRAEGWIHIAGPAREQVLLTEGPMKADVIHFLTGQTVLAVPGVNALTRLEAVLRDLMASGVRHVMTAFDMDFMTNAHVRSGYNDLTWMLHGLGLTFGTYLWQPEYKGLDDYVWECLMRKSHAQ